MSQLPRIAIGTIQQNADLTAMLWALLDALERSGLRVQHFLSHAYFIARDGSTAITGRSSRHLDSWLMDEPTCREAFLRGCRSSDLAVVSGSLASPQRKLALAGSDFETLCRWLDLPRLAVVDARLMSACQLPERPANVDGLLLDRVQDAAELAHLQTLLESLWHVPVWGSLGTLERLRAAVAATSPGRCPGLELCHELGSELLRGAKIDQIYHVAAHRKFSRPKSRAERPTQTSSRGPKIAVAYDKAFHCYFPDAMEMLEARGAVIEDFSPLRDDRLPAETDIVYLGCGHPEQFIEELAANDCMMLALKSHLCSGRRMYAECGGLAYLCQQIELPDGRSWPMVGALPATATLAPASVTPQPTELTTSADTWLGRAPQTLRGYLNPRWSLKPHMALRGCAAESGHEFDVVGRHQAVASRMHLHFATQNHLMDRFFSPHPLAGETSAAAAPRPT